MVQDDIVFARTECCSNKSNKLAIWSNTNLFYDSPTLIWFATAYLAFYLIPNFNKAAPVSIYVAKTEYN